MTFHGVEESRQLLHKLDRKLEDDDVPEGDRIALQEQRNTIDRLFGKRISASYKIEIQFGKDRSMWKPFHGVMSLLLSGTKLNGGGDEKLYVCPRDDCKGIVFPDDRVGLSVVCRSCEMLWPERKLVGEIFLNLTAQNWAKALVTWFGRLEQKADIYLKYHPTDIRYQASIEQERQKGGELLNRARNKRGLHIYPLRNIIKDTESGADLEGRFFAFINS